MESLFGEIHNLNEEKAIEAARDGKMEETLAMAALLAVL